MFYAYYLCNEPFLEHCKYNVCLLNFLIFKPCCAMYNISEIIKFTVGMFHFSSFACFKLLNVFVLIKEAVSTSETTGQFYQNAW
jgi:hypothetical protein